MKKLLSLLLILILLLPVQRAEAASDVTVSIKSEALQEGMDNWKVSCEFTGSGKVTNGKVRITYDSKQLKLVSSEAGEIMKSISPSINDPIQGNKEEGEIVFAFASATEFEIGGSALDMVFALNDSVKNGDAVEIKVAVEELGSDSGEPECKEEPLSITVGSGEGGDNSQQTESESETNTESDESSKQQKDTTSQSSENSQNQDGNGSSNGSGTSGSDSQGGTTGQGDSQNDSAKTASQVKTGDSTRIWIPLTVAVVAVVVFAAAVISKKKKN